MSVARGVVDGRPLRRLALILAAVVALVVVFTLLTGTAAAHAAVTPDDPGEGVTIDINGVDGGPSGSILTLLGITLLSVAPAQIGRAHV